MAAAYFVVSVAGFLATAAWLPGLGPQARALVVLVVLTLGLLVLLSVTGAWRRVGLVTDGRWDQWALLLVPLLFGIYLLRRGARTGAARDPAAPA